MSRSIRLTFRDAADSEIVTRVTASWSTFTGHWHKQHFRTGKSYFQAIHKDRNEAARCDLYKTCLTTESSGLNKSWLYCSSLECGFPFILYLDTLLVDAVTLNAIEKKFWREEQVLWSNRPAVMFSSKERNGARYNQRTLQSEVLETKIAYNWIILKKIKLCKT